MFGLPLFIAALIPSLVLAEDAPSEAAFGDMVIPAVDIKHHFPDNPFQSVVNGQPVDLLLSFRNVHTQPLRIISMGGAFTQPNVYENVLRNVRLVETPIFLT